MGIRPQPAHIKWPFDAKTAEGIEKNFRTLFQDTKQLDGGVVPVELGGTGQTAFDEGDLLYADSATTVDGLPITTTAGRFLRSDGSLPEWSVLILPNAASQGDLLFGSAADTITTLAKDANATRYLSNTGTANNPAWAQVNLANGVTGDLPYANLVPASAASLLLGRGSASGAGDWQEVTLGANLTMTNQVLSASGGGSGGYFEPLTNGDPTNPELIFADGDVIMVEIP